MVTRSENEGKGVILYNPLCLKPELTARRVHTVMYQSNEERNRNVRDYLTGAGKSERRYDMLDILSDGRVAFTLHLDDELIILDAGKRTVEISLAVPKKTRDEIKSILELN